MPACGCVVLIDQCVAAKCPISFCIVAAKRQLANVLQVRFARQILPEGSRIVFEEAFSHAVSAAARKQTAKLVGIHGAKLM